MRECEERRARDEGGEGESTHVANSARRSSQAEAAAKAALRAVVAALGTFLDGREEAVKEAARIVEKVQVAGVQSDKATWARKMERKIRRKNAEAAKVSEGGRECVCATPVPY